MKTGDWIQAVSLILVTITVVGMMIQLRQVMAQTKLLGASSNHAVIESLVQASWLPRAAFFMDEPELMRWHLTMRGVCKG